VDAGVCMITRAREAGSQHFARLRRRFGYTRYNVHPNAVVDSVKSMDARN
jgi:hypothetical protein